MLPDNKNEGKWWIWVSQTYKIIIQLIKKNLLSSRQRVGVREVT